MSGNQNPDASQQQQAVITTRVQALSVLRKFNHRNVGDLVLSTADQSLPELITAANSIINDRHSSADPQNPLLLSQEALDTWVQEYETELAVLNSTLKPNSNVQRSPNLRPQLPPLRFSDVARELSPTGDKKQI